MQTQDGLWKTLRDFKVFVEEGQAEVGLGLRGLAKGAAGFGQKQAVGRGGAERAGDAEEGEHVAGLGDRTVAGKVCGSPAAARGGGGGIGCALFCAAFCAANCGHAAPAGIRAR